MRNLIAAAALLAATCAHADWSDTLQARDLDGNGTVDAFYDTSLNITWLKDANYAATTDVITHGNSAGGPGLAQWSVADAWATSLSFGGITGWRLPTADGVLTPGCDFALNNGFLHCQYTPTDPNSGEMIHLFNVTLGNPFGSIPPGGTPAPDLGPFINVAGNYWSGTIVDTMGGLRHQSMTFNMLSGIGDYAQLADGGMLAWAVHNGDVGVAVPIPEPSTYALLLAGLGAVGWVARRRRA